MTKRPRILVIENSIAVTGALISITRSSTVLKENFDFVFVLPKGSLALTYLRSEGFSVHVLPMRELSRNFGSIVLYVPTLIINTVRLFSLVKRLKIDLINVNDFYNLLPCCYRFLGGNIPYVCYVRFLPSKFPGPLRNTLLFLQDKHTSTFVSVSETVKKEMSHQQNVVVIGNELPEYEVPYVPNTSHTLLYVANYIQGKGQEFALESFHRICAKHPNWRLRFVGGDMGLKKNESFKNFLMSEAVRLGLQDRVEWLGFSSNLSPYYLESAIVLNFSLSESFSLTCLEGLYHGRPVIATRSGGPSEIIDNGETGLLVNIKDIAAMANAMDDLITDQNKRNRMGENGYVRIREKFSHKNTSWKLRDVYNSVLLKESFNTR